MPSNELLIKYYSPPLRTLRLYGKFFFTENPEQPNKKAGLLPRRVAQAAGFSPSHFPLKITPRSLHRCIESRESVNVEEIFL